MMMESTSNVSPNQADNGTKSGTGEGGSGGASTPDAPPTGVSADPSPMPAGAKAQHHHHQQQQQTTEGVNLSPSPTPVGTLASLSGPCLPNTRIPLSAVGPPEPVNPLTAPVATTATTTSSANAANDDDAADISDKVHPCIKYWIYFRKHFLEHKVNRVALCAEHMEFDAFVQFAFSVAPLSKCAPIACRPGKQDKQLPLAGRELLESSYRYYCALLSPNSCFYVDHGERGELGLFPRRSIPVPPLSKLSASCGGSGASSDAPSAAAAVATPMEEGDDGNTPSSSSSSSSASSSASHPALMAGLSGFLVPLDRDVHAGSAALRRAFPWRHDAHSVLVGPASLIAHRCDSPMVLSRPEALQGRYAGVRRITMTPKPQPPKLGAQLHKRVDSSDSSSSSGNGGAAMLSTSPPCSPVLELHAQQQVTAFVRAPSQRMALSVRFAVPSLLSPRPGRVASVAATVHRNNGSTIATTTTTTTTSTNASIATTATATTTTSPLSLSGSTRDVRRCSCTACMSQDAGDRVRAAKYDAVNDVLLSAMWRRQASQSPLSHAEAMARAASPLDVHFEPGSGLSASLAGGSLRLTPIPGRVAVFEGDRDRGSGGGGGGAALRPFSAPPRMHPTGDKKGDSPPRLIPMAGSLPPDQAGVVSMDTTTGTGTSATRCAADHSVKEEQRDGDGDGDGDVDVDEEEEEEDSVEDVVAICVNDTENIYGEMEKETHRTCTSCDQRMRLETHFERVRDRRRRSIGGGTAYTSQCRECLRVLREQDRQRNALRRRRHNKRRSPSQSGKRGRGRRRSGYDDDEGEDEDEDDIGGNVEQDVSVEDWVEANDKVKDMKLTKVCHACGVAKPKVVAFRRQEVDDPDDEEQSEFYMFCSSCEGVPIDRQSSPAAKTSACKMCTKCGVEKPVTRRYYKKANRNYSKVCLECKDATSLSTVTRSGRRRPSRSANSSPVQVSGGGDGNKCMCHQCGRNISQRQASGSSHGLCKRCARQVGSGRMDEDGNHTPPRRTRKKRRSAQEPPETHRQCARCHVTKVMGEFHKCGTDADGVQLYRTSCRDCYNAYLHGRRHGTNGQKAKQQRQKRQQKQLQLQQQQQLLQRQHEQQQQQMYQQQQPLQSQSGQYASPSRHLEAVVASQYDALVGNQSPSAEAQYHRGSGGGSQALLSGALSVLSSQWGAGGGSPDGNGRPSRAAASRGSRRRQAAMMDEDDDAEDDDDSADVDVHTTTASPTRRRRSSSSNSASGRGRGRARAPMLPTDRKRCTRCGEEKPVVEFSKAGFSASNGRQLYRGQCKPCYNQEVQASKRRKARKQS